jgi:hypothetical protein
MEKSDKSIHNICVASIKRHTRTPYEFKWTRFYEENITFPEIEIELSENELVICSTVIDKDNFSVLTSQKLTTKESGVLLSGKMNGATDRLYGDFKGYQRGLFTFGVVQLDNGNELKYFIETGRASMVMIYGVRTRIGMALQ